MIVFSSSLVLSDAQGVNANNPLIGYDNRATVSSTTTTTAAAGFPATNLANPATYSRWQAEETGVDEYIMVVPNDDEPIDYFAVARHNFGSAQIPVSIEYTTDNLGGSPIDWTEAVQDVLLSDDSPVLFRFNEVVPTAIRLRMQPGDDVATAAVVYTGKLLVVQRRIYVGHTPIKYGRQTKITNGRSESGNFLGRIVTGEKVTSAVALQNLTPGWYREYLDPFLQSAQEAPFFFAWRPSDYPREVGYAWLTNDPQPNNQRHNGMMQIQLQFEGVV